MLTLLAICTAGVLKNSINIRSQFTSFILNGFATPALIERIYSNATFILLRKDSINVDIATILKSTHKYCISDMVLSLIHI